MNYLAHLLLAGDAPDALIGNFLGDFVKGPLDDYRSCYNREILNGIATHRLIDEFTDCHPIYRQSRRRLRDRFFRVSGIIIDVTYDHFLTQHWALFSDSRFDEFVNHFYEILQKKQAILPPKARAIVPKAVTENWLASYRTLAGVERTLDSLAKRLKRETPLTVAGAEIREHYTGLEADFLCFFPKAIFYAKNLAIEARDREIS